MHKVVMYVVILHILGITNQSLAPEHVNKLLTSLSEDDKLNRYQHREQLYDTSIKHHIYMCLQYYLVWPINGSQMCDV